jgi:SPP1 family phage portal protein
MAYTGRKKILCSETEITSQNVVKVLSDALVKHLENNIECDYLYNYRKGKQPILSRTKEVRPEICNKIVENRADEIVAFKTGYLCGEPLQYVSRGSTDNVSADIGKLNDMMLLCGKSALDKDLAEWMYTCGTGYRMVVTNSHYVTTEIVPKLNNRQTDFSEDEAPFEIYTLDPRYTFVVYNSGLGEKPLMAVKYVVQNFGVINEQVKTVYSVWTNTSYFEITSSAPVVELNATVSEKKTTLGTIPIIEYPLNNARLGAFEVVLTILDAINTTQSNRLDGVEQFIQSLILLYNCDIDDDSAKSLREAGLVKLKSVGDVKADLKILAEQLDQDQTQTLIDYMYQTILCITGMPNRNGGSSTSDTGTAVQLRDGWQGAEARAKTDELSFRESERQFLKVVLRIIRGTVGTSLTLADIDIKFTRRIYENAQSKAQTLLSMLGSDKIAPSLAFTHCGLFSDPEDAAKQSTEYYETVKSEQTIQQAKQTDTKEGDGINA